jgi:hypothetical protein
MLARLARLSVDSLHYLKTGFPNKAALRLPCGVANRRITSGYLWSVLSWVAISRYGTVVTIELRRNFAVVNYLSFEMQHSLFELKGKAHYAS